MGAVSYFTHNEDCCFTAINNKHIPTKDNCIKANESILLKLSAERWRTKTVRRKITAKESIKKRPEYNRSLRGNL